MEKVPLPDELQRPAPLSDAQQAELGKRLAHHRAYPDEAGFTLDEIRRKLMTK